MTLCRQLIRLVAALLVLASCTAYAKQPEISLSELVSAADVVFVGRSGSQRSTNDKPIRRIRHDFTILEVLKGSIKTGTAAIVCYPDDGSDTPNVQRKATYIFFGKFGAQGCYEPVNGIRGVARVHDAYVDTRYVKGEAESQPLDEILKRIRARSSRP
jgi:hypothetical protein